MPSHCPAALSSRPRAPSRARHGPRGPALLTSKCLRGCTAPGTAPVNPEAQLPSRWSFLEQVHDTLVKFLLETPASRTSVPGFEWWLGTKSQLSASIYSGRQQMMVQSTWVPASSVEDLDRDPGSWLHSGPALSAQGTRGVNQQFRDHSVSLHCKHTNNLFVKRTDYFQGERFILVKLTQP